VTETIFQNLNLLFSGFDASFILDIKKLELKMSSFVYLIFCLFLLIFSKSIITSPLFAVFSISFSIEKQESSIAFLYLNDISSKRYLLIKSSLAFSLSKLSICLYASVSDPFFLEDHIAFLLGINI